MYDHSITPLVEHLCEEFGLDHKNIDYIQKVEMLYVHDYIVVLLDTKDYETIRRKIYELRKELRTGGKERSLYRLYQYFKEIRLSDPTKYDTTTLRPPVMRDIY